MSKLPGQELRKRSNLHLYMFLYNTLTIPLTSISLCSPCMSPSPSNTSQYFISSYTNNTAPSYYLELFTLFTGCSQHRGSFTVLITVVTDICCNLQKREAG